MKFVLSIDHWVMVIQHLIVLDQVRLGIIRTADVIGCTTTGTSRSIYMYAPNLDSHINTN